MRLCNTQRLADLSARRCVLFMPVFIRLGRADKPPEQGMGLIGPALQLWVELAGHKPGVVGQLHHFYQAAVRGQAGPGQAGSGQRLPETEAARLPSVRWQG